MISAEYPWFVRGGGYYITSLAGVFYFSTTNGLGGAGSDNSFRLVMSATSP